MLQSVLKNDGLNSIETPKNGECLILRDVPGSDKVLTPDALEFLGKLNAEFSGKIRDVLLKRHERQKEFDAGIMPKFLPETMRIRHSEWEAAPTPKVLQDRRVEITGPVDRKMMINALNSGAKMFMADFEDASAPRFDVMIAGQANLIDYRDGNLSFDDPKSGKSYRLKEKTAIMIIRPRGLHLEEANLLFDGKPIPASLFDFGLHIFHNGKNLLETNRGPFYYLPKTESYLEARLWNEIFVFAQDYIGIPQGSIKATILVETLPAAFEMDEIIWELREHIVGLNCGRWDYIFSYIKTLRNHPEYVLPDRAIVTMDRAFLATYAARLVKVCHRRGVHAMGGMAAQIPVKGDNHANDAAFEKVRADKLREVQMGYDGTWVAHPDLVPIAMQVFDTNMPNANQVNVPRQYYRTEEAKLLTPHEGKITEKGIRTNISVAIEYLSQWLCGRGAVPIHNLMEDAATAEISRAQLWQWVKHGAIATTTAGHPRQVTQEWFGEILQEEVGAILDKLGGAGFHKGHYASAVRLLQEAVTAEVLPDFITLPAYDVLNALD